MAAITKTTFNSYGQTTIAVTELTGTDTLIPKSGDLYIYNTTGSSEDITIDGDESTTVNTPTAGVVDVSGGYTMTVAAGAMGKIKLGDIAGFLSGAVSVTGGTTGVFAWVV